MDPSGMPQDHPNPVDHFVPRNVSIPRLVRMKSGALDRMGIYLKRIRCVSAQIFFSDGLPPVLLERLTVALQREGVGFRQPIKIEDASVERADSIVETLASGSGDEFPVVIGMGGGKATDAAKYISHRMQKPYFAIPTSLSNDGFCSPQSSLTVSGRRRSIPTIMPAGIVVDLDVCLQAPKRLWLSGVGDLVSKITAVRDWKRAFHHDGTYVDDFAALLSDSSVYQFIAKPSFDRDGTKRLASALMLNGVAMAIGGSSRPASGSEHLISHALDQTCESPDLHGFQVGIATYLVSQLHGIETETIDRLFESTGFWDACLDHGLTRAQWQRAIRIAPSIKTNFHTILSEIGQIERLLQILNQDPRLKRILR